VQAQLRFQWISEPQPKGSVGWTSAFATSTARGRALTVILPPIWSILMAEEVSVCLLKRETLRKFWDNRFSAIAIKSSQYSLEPLAEIVGDKGYHSNDTVLNVQQAQARSYFRNRSAGGASGRARPTSRRRCTRTVAGSKVTTESGC